MNKSKSKISSLGTIRTFFRVGTCSEALCNVLNRANDNPMIIEENASMPFAGGIIRQGYQCGQLWGAALAAGAQAYRLFGPGPQAETAAVITAQRLVESFRNRYKEIDCFELTEMPWKNVTAMQVIKYFIKGKAARCFIMSAGYATIANKEINSALFENPIEAPSQPLSCAALLAQKMGLSELHTTMAAGFAGGIGLSGGACGALGAAIWIINLQDGLKGIKVDYENPKGLALIETFLKNSDFEFECSKIVGRKFENIQDHAAYLRDGGCSKIISALAAQESY